MRILMLLMVALLCAAPAMAKPSYDGLTLVGSGQTFVDEEGGTLTVMAFRTKYQEPVVGFYFTQGNASVRFYANAATWDKLKQLFIKARDQWDTLTPAQFEMLGSVQSYRIANRVSTMNVSLQGATTLQSRELLLSASGGANKPVRAFVDLDQQNLRGFVEQLYAVDAMLKGSASR